MSTADRHIEVDAFIALLEGELSSADAAHLHARIQASPELQAEFAIWTTLFRDLEQAGDAIVQDIPAVNLVDSVMSAVAQLNDDGDPDISFDRLLDLAEGRLEKTAAAALRHRIAESEALQADFDWVRSLQANLGRRGDAIANLNLSVDLLSGVMANLADAEATDTSSTFYNDLLELRDGQLPLREANQLRLRLEQSEFARAEAAWVNEIAGELECLGDAINIDAGEIDVTDAVMELVGRITRPQEVVSLDAERVRRRGLIRLVGALAAAAMVALAAGTAWRMFAPSRPETMITRDTTPASTNTPQYAEFMERKRDLDQQRQGTGATMPQRMLSASAPAIEPIIEATEPPQLDALTADDIKDAVRNNGIGNLRELKQLAALTREQAKTLIENPATTPQAIVGLSDSLMPDEKEQALLTVVGSLPDSPFLQLELLATASELPPGESESEDPLAYRQTLSELDPNNALPLYFEAKMLLEAGDTEAAILALKEARELEHANPYSREAAAYHQRALIESGMEPEAAQLLTAFTAGASESDSLFRLAVNLLEFGDFYNSQNDLLAAQQIYESVHRLGEQIQAGAVYSEEQLVALDIQSAAIDVLAPLYDAMGLVDEIGTLTTQTMEIAGNLESLTGFFNQFSSLLTDFLSPSFWNSMAGAILSDGDLGILNYLQVLGLSSESPQP